MAATDHLTDDDLDRLRDAVERVEDERSLADVVSAEAWEGLQVAAQRLLSTATHREAVAPVPVRADPWEDAWEPVVGEYVSIDLERATYTFPGTTELAGTVTEVSKGSPWPYYVRVTYGTAPVTQTLPFSRDEIAEYVLERGDHDET